MKLLRSLALLLFPLAAVSTAQNPLPRYDVYAIACTRAVMEDPEWRAVVEALENKHHKDFAGVFTCTLPNRPGEGGEERIIALLRSTGARYAAFVMKPEEIGRKTVSTLHRATRKVDDDPWGDCMWGIVTGATAKDALRIATAAEPLVIKRLLATTNVHHAPFEHSCCITDWTNAPVREQSGYTEPTTQEFPKGTGREQLFAEQLATQKPQFIVTSSHATQFNLEMPFGKGLIFPSGGQFHCLSERQMPWFGKALGAAMQGNHKPMDTLGEATPAIEPDGEPRIWLAAGNCLIGNAQHSASSMVITALSSYTCNQFVGYTVPSWYGKGGWGTLSLFLGNTESTTLAEAWFLNNQFILHETMKLSPELLQAEFNSKEMDASFFRDMAPVLQSSGVTHEQAKDALGLVHDRDVVAFYGDPAWQATVDNSHSPRPLLISWAADAKSFTITAGGGYKGRAAVWFPTAATGKNATGCDAEGAVFTNDFILFPELELRAGETRCITIH